MQKVTNDFKTKKIRCHTCAIISMSFEKEICLSFITASVLNSTRGGKLNQLYKGEVQPKKEKILIELQRSHSRYR